LRRDDDIGTSSAGRVVNFPSVVRTISSDAVDLPFGHVKQGREDGSVGHVIVREFCSHNASLFVYGQV